MAKRRCKHGRNKRSGACLKHKRRKRGPAKTKLARTRRGVTKTRHGWGPPAGASTALLGGRR